jgi:hypothetical protein
VFDADVQRLQVKDLAVNYVQIHINRNVIFSSKIILCIYL